MYQWSVNGGPAGTNAPTYSTTTLATGDIVSCTLTSNAQCTTTATASACSPAMTVHPLPTSALSYPGTISSSATYILRLTDTNGRLLQTGVISKVGKWFIGGAIEALAFLARY